MDTTDGSFVLAQKVCEAMEQREYSQLPFLLNTSAHQRGNNNDDRIPADENDNISKCQQILRVFYFSIGRNDIGTIGNNCSPIDEIIIPAAIKSHLLLRAILHPNNSNSPNSLSWEAAVAAIQSIQYSCSQSSIHHNNSVSEDMAMISEIRQFITNLRSGRHNFHDGGKESIENVTNTLECLSELGLVIIDPLLIRRDDNVDTNSENEKNKHRELKRINYKEIHQDNHSYKRREHSYLLPLELLPGILASLDTLDDLLADLVVAQQQQREEEVEWEHREFVEIGVEMNNDASNDGDGDHDNNKDEDDDAELHTRYSDKLLSAIYVPFITTTSSRSNGGVDKCDKLHRSIRADAALPLLALAIDDIGLERMAMTVPMICIEDYNDEEITYWDCLALSLHHVIRSNLLCYANNDEREVDNDGQQIINEATNDEGMHVIAPSDYPAMVRCVFRIIATNSSHVSKNNSQHTLEWESLLLQLYHAATVVSAKLPSIKSIRPRRNNSASDHHSATLPTVESHVLLPSFTGASVMAIRSILDSCQQESCLPCMRMSVSTTWWRRFTTDDATTPTWAVAGIVLLIMRARSANISNAMGSSSTFSFGPRAVFRIASDIMHRAASNNDKSVVDEQKRIGLGCDDEIGRALTVLLAIRGGGSEEGSGCLSCSDEMRYNADADKCALDVLGDTYYAGSGKFCHKYLPGQEEKGPYAYQLGHKTLTQYANLVCSSLNQGKLDSSGRIKSSESSISETAKTWIDAAYMLLDEMTSSESREGGSSRKSNASIPNGTAMALTIIVVVFCEVPTSQHDIVRSVYNRIVTSSSRTSNDSSKRKASEMCFSLASLLAWSMVANYERNSCLNFVRRKDDKNDEIRAELAPLCNLLATPAPVYDVLLDTEKPSLSYWSLQQLSRSLIPISSGREAILAMAKKHLRLTSTSSPYSYASSQVIPFSESMPSTPTAMKDALNFVVDCLCNLIEKHDPTNDCSIPDEYGLEALVMITDIIVSSSSSLLTSSKVSSARVPRVILSRLLKELITAVKKSRLDEWILHRLQRSCFLAVINFFESEDSSSPPELMTRRVFRSTSNGASFQITTDVLAILQLIMSIQNSLCKCKAAFYSSLPQQIINVFTEKTLQRVSNEVTRSDGSESSDDIDSAFVNYLLCGVAKAVQNDKFVQAVNVDSSISQQMIHGIVQAERDHYRTENEPKSPGPNWLDFGHTAQISYGYHELPDHSVDGLKTSDEYKHFYASMCDIVIQTLLCLDEKLDEESEFKDELLQCLYHVLGKRRQVRSDKDATSSLQNVSFDDPSRRLLDLSSQQLRLLVSNSELPKIDLVLRNVIQFCDESECLVPSVQSTWKLYCSLDEASSQSLISCIKKYYLDKGRWRRVKAKGNENISLLFIDSSDSLGEHVRYYRTVILDKVLKDLTSIAESTVVTSLEERTSNVRLCLRLLLKLVKDWRTAFNGLSGSMDKVVFNDFLEAVDKCMDAITSYIDNLPSRVLFEVKDDFLNVLHSTSTVWSIFKEEKLYGYANHIKGTVRLCIDKMPQLLRRLESLVGKALIDETVSNYSITLLEQCLLQIKTDEISESSDTKAQVPEPNSGGDKVSTATSSQPTEEECEERVFEIESEEKKSVVMLNISSESVEWVYTCVITAFQKMWSDYYKLISRGSKTNAIVPIQEISGTLSLRKRRELSSTLAATCKVFVEINPSSKASMMFVELFSYQGKSILCKCLESVAMTLISSIKQINQYFQDDRKQHRQRHEKKTFDAMKLSEPLICILGWLSSARENGTAHDIITGAIQWYANEKERLNVMFARSEDYPVFNRLPKLMYRLEVLEAELRKLLLILTDASAKARKEKVSLLDRMTNDLTDGDEANASLSELVEEYLRVLDSRKNEMKIDGIESAALGGGNGEDAESDPGGGMARKRLKQQFGPRRKRRMSLRSRNDTIDDWLTLDDEFATAPGERYNDVDAFVDLEDFLVDG